MDFNPGYDWVDRWRSKFSIPPPEIVKSKADDSTNSHTVAPSVDRKEKNSNTNTGNFLIGIKVKEEPFYPDESTTNDMNSSSCDQEKPTDYKLDDNDKSFTENKRRRNDLPMRDKHEALRLLDLKMSQSWVARHLGCSASQINRISLNRQQILSDALDGNMGQNRKRKRAGKAADVESALYEWYKYDNTDGENVSYQTLRNKAASIAKEQGNNEFIPRTVWLARWKRRFSIPSVKRNELSATEIGRGVYPYTDGNCAGVESSSDHNANSSEDTNEIPSDNQTITMNIKQEPPNEYENTNEDNSLNASNIQTPTSNSPTDGVMPVNGSLIVKNSYHHKEDEHLCETHRKVQDMLTVERTKNDDSPCASDGDDAMARATDEMRVTEKDSVVTEEEVWRCVRTIEQFLVQNGCEQLNALHELQIVVAKTATAKQKLNTV